jgi:hypothetical protein
MNNIKPVCLLLFGIMTCSFAANVANPGSLQSGANISAGASYHLGGYTLTNKKIPALFNRFHGRFDYTPWQFLSLGIDLGTIQLDVERYTSGTQSIGLFHGKYGFSGGAHLRLATPYIIKQSTSVFMFGQATMFKSKNEYEESYEGIDGTGVIAIQLKLGKIGAVSIGPLVYLIEGENKSRSGIINTYSNINNVRGWIAFDYLIVNKDNPDSKTYITLEFSASPKANYSKRIPIQEFSVSLAAGFISGKLGKVKEN